ncbi:hypothetical protein AB1Y20_006524 [Prymnesium parvum]|uniref:HTTM domain-containing protein n=1 Tax=Prymnesium parvum TaxID=97485 RepID=A0AB34J0J6_PRYPA
MERLPPEEEWRRLTTAERMDACARDILLHGMGRPAVIYLWHAALLFLNYSAFALVAFGIGSSATGAHKATHTLVKLLVWQQLAESVGCRQGPMYGHLGLPCNFRYRLSTGTVKLSKLPSAFGSTRHAADLLSHVLWYAAALGFVLSREYRTAPLHLLAACSAYHFLSDSTQFYAAGGHIYFSALLSASAPPAGRLAGMQLALLLQWFFSGFGKLGPWFSYVNGPFMLQSCLLTPLRPKLFAWLVHSPSRLTPTAFGVAVAHAAAAVEYLAPLALLLSSETAIACGMAGLLAMHAYILAMPAPFDVYSWNLCYALCVPYLFYWCGTFGFDWDGLARMPSWLLAYFAVEAVVCLAGNLLPDRIGYYLSHRYWAGNWCFMFFLVRDTDAARQKLARVRAFSPNPLDKPKLSPHVLHVAMTKSLAYLWLGNLNMKPLVALIEEACAAGGGTPAAYKFAPSLPLYYAGEFRDFIFGEELMPQMQACTGFEEGECMAIKVNAFSLFGARVRMSIYDLSKGQVRSYALSRSQLRSMAALPSSAPACEKWH